MEANSILAGKYRLVSLLGQGGMGAVWRAEHLALQAPVAIKLISVETEGYADLLVRFQREAKAAAALRSPHVVQILDYGVDTGTGTPFIAMELLEGESLAERLQRKGMLSPDEAVRILSHVGRALTRAHAANIVHRDLKPDNIFLVRNEEEEIAKVLDFGIAKVDTLAVGGDATATGMVFGTAYYMSPEQISGAKGVDHRTDLWALGVIAHECLTGQRPFVADSLGGLVLQICSQQISVPSNVHAVPPGFDGWFARAVNRNPEARFQTAREFVDALREVCREAPRSSVLSPQEQFDATILPTDSGKISAPQPSYPQPSYPQPSYPQPSSLQPNHPQRGDSTAQQAIQQPVLPTGTAGSLSNTVSQARVAPRTRSGTAMIALAVALPIGVLGVGAFWGVTQRSQAPMPAESSMGTAVSMEAAVPMETAVIPQQNQVPPESPAQQLPAETVNTPSMASATPVVAAEHNPQAPEQSVAVPAVPNKPVTAPKPAAPRPPSSPPAGSAKSPLRVLESRR